MPKNVDSMVGDLVGTLTDPIIVYPGGWGDTLPEWLKHAITLERLMGNMKDRATGTEAEACAYLSTASLTGPMGYDWSQIYLYVAGKTMSQWNKSEMPDDVRVDSLNDYQMVELNRLKEWLYQRRTTARKEAEISQRRQRKDDEAEKSKAERPALFEF